MTRKRFNDLSKQKSREQSLNDLSDKILHNVKLTTQIIKHCSFNKINHYRLSSKLFPLITDPALEIQLDDLPRIGEIKTELANAGQAIKDLDISISIHADQLNVLASEKPEVVEKTIKELNFHAWLLDEMGMPEGYDCPINTHPSVSTKDPSDINLKKIIDRFWQNFQKTNDGVKKRLVIENEDKGCWNCMNLFKYFHIYTRENYNHPFPLTYNNLHNKCNPSEINGQEVTEEQNIQAFYHTWGTSPVFHWSVSKSDKPNEKRIYADYLDKEIPEFNNTDGIPFTIKWECEVKTKDKAIFKILNKEPMVRAAWKTKKIVTPKKEDIKAQAQPQKQAPKEPQPTEKPREQKSSSMPYNQIYGR
tara:strand:+ start:353 stop:1438 length:1086 start_codon:yes stop_codon:yes gene_type:complete